MKGKKLMNENYEIYSSCRHQSSFQRFHLSTDERCRQERGNVDRESEVEYDGGKNKMLSIRIPNEVFCQLIDSSHKCVIDV